MSRTAISLLALSLLAMSHIAGAEEVGTLTIEDASLDPMPPAASAYADIVGGRLELVEGDTLRATIEIAALPEVQPGIAYVLVFSAGDAQYYAALVTAPEMVYAHGRWDGEGPGTMHDGSGSYTTGPDATITIEMPLSAVPDVGVLTEPLAYVVDIKPGLLPLPVGFLVLDEAAGEGELVVREPPSEPASADGEVTAAALAESSEDEATPARATDADPQPDKRVPAPAAFLVIAALALVAWAHR